MTTYKSLILCLVVFLSLAAYFSSPKIANNQSNFSIQEDNAVKTELLREVILKQKERPEEALTESNQIPLYKLSTYNNYVLSSDSGHEAGYDWADKKGIDNVDDCGGNSNSFIEGCVEYVKENYPSESSCDNYNETEEICDD